MPFFKKKVLTFLNNNQQTCFFLRNWPVFLPPTGQSSKFGFNPWLLPSNQLNKLLLSIVRYLRPSQRICRKLPLTETMELANFYLSFAIFKSFNKHNSWASIEPKFVIQKPKKALFFFSFCCSLLVFGSSFQTNISKNFLSMILFTVLRLSTWITLATALRNFGS